MDAIELKARVIVALREFFAKDPDFPFTDNFKQTRINIADIYGIDRDVKEQRPLVLVGRGEMGFERLGIGSVSGSKWSSSDNPPGMQYSNIINGIIAIHCLSVAGAESEIIATKIANFFEMTRHEIRPILGILQMSNIQIGAEAQLKEWPDFINVPVSFKYMYATRWDVLDLDVIIKNIKGSIAANC